MRQTDEATLYNVLIVAMDREVQLSIGSALEAAGFVTHVAANALSALDEFHARPTDCIILDINMPGTSGLDICRTFRKLDSSCHVPILMQTTVDDMNSVQRAYDAGATDFASKGINPMLLAHRVKFLIRAKQTQDRLRASEARVRYLAYFDTLTGLPNRQRLLEVLGQQVALAVLERRGMTVLMLDIDNFARINDTQGQAAGDSLLKEVANRLRRCLDGKGFEPLVDAVARTGADEFAIALPGVRSLEEAHDVARRIQTDLVEPCSFGQEEITLSASIGISILTADASDAEALIKNADAAMHHAKRVGQGSIECFQQSISARAARHISLEADLRKALSRDEFTLVYQPRLALGDLRVAAVEALIRWSHPRRGLVPPDEFIPLAEQCGLIVEIGDWVLREACAQARRWREGATDWRVAVNVSGVQFRDGSLPRRVARAIDAAGIEASSIELEFTEGALIEYTSAVGKAVGELKALGVGTALDDFGTGYSSMAYLRHFPIDTLKIDRVFVRDIAMQSAGDAPLVDAIIAMAKSMRLVTVAEGVETQAQWHYLRTRGADQVQGFLFCKPLAIGALERWYADWLSFNAGRASAAR